ncbi:MFS transporter [Streptomyces hoynatensis]|uniref:MFS transporter n=1 Tax=Streptomyces hoynatensis TaxID=1141874 RepID=A0A3A9Z443_9ACTN|nr:MFS transporter [Streptomyces hoynatensis]RKN43010.1 MFS transporter [Streptomyces hoynatensis]
MEKLTEAPGRRDHRWLGLFAVLAAMIMNLLDATVVNVAAPSIREDLGGSEAGLQWIAASYTLALAVGLLTGGRLGDMFGRRRMALLGVAGFLAASVACALAWSPEALIGARVAQGLCAAIMIPQSFGLIRDLFPPQEIGKAFGALGPVIGLSTILGPVVAGVLVDADLFGTGWRMVFLINLPLGAFALSAGARALPRSRGARELRLDVPGALLAGAAMFLLVFPLVQGRELGWPAWLLAPAAGSVAGLAAFAARQAGRRRAGRAPLVELSVLTRRSYTSGVAFTLVFFGSVVGFSLALGLFLQLGLGFGPAKASVAMATWAVGAFFGSGFGAAMRGRLGRRILHLGLTLMAVGLGGVYLVFDRSGMGLDGADLALPLLVYGFGMGQIFVPLFDIVMGEIRDHEVGSAAGLLESVQQLGSSLGVAVLGTVFFSAAGKPGPGAGFVTAGRHVTLLALGLLAVAFLLGFLLPRRARQDAAAQAPEQDAAARKPEQATAAGEPGAPAGATALGAATVEATAAGATAPARTAAR